MARNRYYYYDQDRCTFVEVEADPKRFAVRASAFVTAVLLIAFGLTAAFDVHVSAEEVELAAENEALQSQLKAVENRMDALSDQLATLAESDQTLYRTLLDADPLDEDVRQVGVGGADPYEAFDRYSTDATDLLRRTSQKLDELERQVGLQNTSYRDLASLAKERESWLREMPAIMPTNGPVVSGYGMRRHPILRVRKMHYGLDIVVDRGTPVVATGDGVVREVGVSATYGKFVKVHHAATGYTTLYAHLSDFADGLRRGQRVERGEQIAFSGNTGRSTAPHLHYEVRDEDNLALNPLQFLSPSMTPETYRRMLEEADRTTVSLD